MYCQSYQHQNWSSGQDNHMTQASAPIKTTPVIEARALLCHTADCTSPATQFFDYKMPSTLECVLYRIHRAKGLSDDNFGTEMSKSWRECSCEASSCSSPREQRFCPLQACRSNPNRDQEQMSAF